MGRQQHSGSVMIMMIVVMLILTAASVFGTRLLSVLSRQSGQSNATVSSLEAARKGLVNFVSVNGYLPCPADGSLDTGVSNPVGATTACNRSNGTLPWATLGLNQAASLDGWSRKISYRVYQGQTGLTIAGGADMSNCKIDPPAPAAPAAPGRLCALAHTTSGDPTSPIGFLSNAYRPGLSFSDLGTPVSQVGFVLISHGETGYGAWLLGGGRMPLPPAGNVAEFANTQVGATYYRQTYSDKTVVPTANNHFDDETVYMTIADVINQAGRKARTWATALVGAAPPVSMSGSLLSNALQLIGKSFTGQSSGVASLTLPSTLVAASPLLITTGSGSVIAMNSAQTAIGVCAGAPAVCDDTTALITEPEFLSFLLTRNTAMKAALVLQYSGGVQHIQLTFKLDGVVVGSPMVTSSAGLTDLSPTPATPFNEVVVTPKTHSNSAFFVQSIQFCDGVTACP